jgi:ribonuclease Z
MKFELTILGCGSALPVVRRGASAQVLSIQERYFLIDCGEGTQVQLRRFKVKFQKIEHIFISHLHGDHFFGLIGLISSLHLLGRTRTMHIYGPPGLQEILEVQFKHSETFLRFPIEYHTTRFDKNEIIYEDNVVTVESLVLNHRIPCCGFLFREKKKPRKMRKDQLEIHNIPVAAIPGIKSGDDFTTENGQVIPNKSLTNPSAEARSYAYCSDTAYHEPLIPALENVDLLYHEATFLSDREENAKQTNHSTAKQAATIAKAANVKQLILGHYSARYRELEKFIEEAKPVFDNCILAEEGQRYTVPLKASVD